MFVTLIVIILVIVAFVGFLDFNDHMFQQKTGHITIPPSQGNSKHPLTYLPPTGAIYASGNAIYKYNYTSLKYGAFGPDLWNLEKAQVNDRDNTRTKLVSLVLTGNGVRYQKNILSI